MGWRDLLQSAEEQVVLPWVGGRTVRDATRAWAIADTAPTEHGWYCWRVLGRRVQLLGPAAPRPDSLRYQTLGYLAGDWLIADGATVYRPFVRFDLRECGERVYLVEAGLDRFVRIAAGRVYGRGPLLFWMQLMPLGPEDEVLQAYLDQRSTVDHIKGVPPALQAAFELAVWQRHEAARQRQEAEQRRQLEAAQRQQAARRQELVRQLGDGAGRRAMAAVDFTTAARAALALSGAELLDERPSVQAGERVVRYRLLGRRFECVCDERTLRIIDAGICLTDESTGEKGDTRFTLETLPAVVQQADREGLLVVFRHV